MNLLFNTFFGQFPRTFWVVDPVGVPAGEVRPNESSVLVVSQSPVPSRPRRAGVYARAPGSELGFHSGQDASPHAEAPSGGSVAACPPAPRAEGYPTPRSPSWFSRRGWAGPTRSELWQVRLSWSRALGAWREHRRVRVPSPVLPGSSRHPEPASRGGTKRRRWGGGRP